MIAIPSSLAVSRTPLVAASVAQREYSISTVATGCTLKARRMVLAEHSERPIWSNLPSFTNSARVFICSSIGLHQLAYLRGERYVLGETRAHSNISSFFFPSRA